MTEYRKVERPIGEYYIEYFIDEYNCFHFHIKTTPTPLSILMLIVPSYNPIYKIIDIIRYNFLVYHHEMTANEEYDIRYDLQIMVNEMIKIKPTETKQNILN